MEINNSVIWVTGGCSGMGLASTRLFLSKGAKVLVTDLNEEAGKNLKKELISNINFIEEILGVGGSDAFSYFQFGIDESTKNRIEDLINQRNEAKKNKDFETADKIRNELSTMDISLMDTVNGTVWEKL